MEFILTQEWNDAKSKLQQCCLTFRSIYEDPQIARYQVCQRVVYYCLGIALNGLNSSFSHSPSLRFSKTQALPTTAITELEFSSRTSNSPRALEELFRPPKWRLRRRLLSSITVRAFIHSFHSIPLASRPPVRPLFFRFLENFKQLNFQKSVISKRYKQPYINKMLDKLDTWDEGLVEQFVGDVPVDGRGAAVVVDDDDDAADEQRSPKKMKFIKEDEGGDQGQDGSDMELEDVEPY